MCDKCNKMGFNAAGLTPFPKWGCPCLWYTHGERGGKGHTNFKCWGHTNFKNK